MNDIMRIVSSHDRHRRRHRRRLRLRLRLRLLLRLRPAGRSHSPANEIKCDSATKRASSQQQEARAAAVSPLPSFSRLPPVFCLLSEQLLSQQRVAHLAGSQRSHAAANGYHRRQEGEREREREREREGKREREGMGEGLTRQRDASAMPPNWTTEAVPGTLSSNMMFY